MGYRIEKNEALSAAFGRIAAEEIAVALGELRRRNRAQAMHNARKALKRLRALLRSLRVAFPKKLFRRENRRFAAVGRKIAPLRDVHVQLRTLGKLDAGPGQASSQIRRHLLQREQTYTRKIPELRRAVRQMLDASRQTVASWPVNQATPPKVAASLKRVYKAGKNAFKIASKNPTPQNLHQWRKQTKTLGYGLELIQCLGPRKIGKWIKNTEQLSESLGDDHDLFLVLHALRQEHAARPAGDFRLLSKRIAARRAKLQKRAFKLATGIYDQKPGVFQKHLQRCLTHKC
jgi:CHAD domain-containing protein